MRSTGSNNFEKMWYMEFGVNTKYVFGLLRAKQIGLEHEEKKPKDYDNDHCQPADPPPLGLTAVKDSMVFVVVETFPLLRQFVRTRDGASAPSLV